MMSLHHERKIDQKQQLAVKSGRASFGKSWLARPFNGSASESSHGLMGSERGRRHPHHRD